MKINTLIITVLVSAAGMMGCTSEDEHNDVDTMANRDTVVTEEVEARSMCYIRTEGTANQDTTSLELVIKDDKVTGQMYWHPFEKDSRKGTLSGTVKGDTVNVVWNFMQEGMQDTLALQFLMQGDHLMQKPLGVITKTGRLQTDSKAGYTIDYRPSVNLKK